jgi:hypothetical protein
VLQGLDAGGKDAGRIAHSPRPSLGTLTAPGWPRWRHVPRPDAYDQARLARGQARDASVGKEARTVVGNEGTWQAEKESGALSRKIKSQNGLRLLVNALARKNPIQVAGKIARTDSFSTYKSHTSHILRFGTHIFHKTC